MAVRATMNISLPASMKEWIDEEIDRGGFGSASEYVRHVLREARARQLRDWLEGELIAGLDSGSAEMTRADWNEIRREGRKRIARRKPK